MRYEIADDDDTGRTIRVWLSETIALRFNTREAHNLRALLQEAMGERALISDAGHVEVLIDHPRRVVQIKIEDTVVLRLEDIERIEVLEPGP